MSMSDERQNLLRLCTRAIQVRTRDAESYALAMADVTAALTPETLRALIHQADKGDRYDEIRRALGVR